MRRRFVIFIAIALNTCGILLAQHAVDPSQRYYRLICLVHLTGSGKAGDPVLPEYVAQGTAVAQAAITVASTATAGNTVQAPAAAAREAATAPTSASTPKAARPGILAWSMQKSVSFRQACMKSPANNC